MKSIAIGPLSLQRHLGLSAQSPKRISKRVPGASRPRGPESQKRVENGVKNPELQPKKSQKKNR